MISCVYNKKHSYNLKQSLNKICLFSLTLFTILLISCGGGGGSSAESTNTQTPSLLSLNSSVFTENVSASPTTTTLSINATSLSNNSIEITDISVDPNPIITIGDYPSNFSKSTSILITASTFYFGQSTLNIKLRYSDGTTTISLPVENKISDISNIDVNYSFSPIKNLTASYTTIPYASGYELYQESTLGAGFAKVAQTSTANQLNIAISIPSSYHQIANDYPRYYTQVLREYNHNGVSKTAIQTPIFNLSNPSLVNDAIGYIKASNTGADDEFGYSISLSADGNTLAISASYENSNATGINGDQSNNDSRYSGAVYIFTRLANNTWSQQAYIKASNTDNHDRFGYSISLSADGATLAVGARREDSNATGINGDQSNNDAEKSGAVYIFTRSADNWSQQAYLKSSNTDADDYFGHSISLSADGATLAVGARYEDSNATGINGDQSNNDAEKSGAVYIFTRSADNWSQQAYLKASNTGENDWFGDSISLSKDGNTLAVGAYHEDSSATGINGDQSNSDASDSGAVYIFTRSAGSWSQQAYLKASNTAEGDYFGDFIFLSADGDTLAAGAAGEDSNATGIDGDQSNNDAEDSGAVYIFTRSAGSWSQQAYIKASNTGEKDYFGNTISLSEDGNILAVGADSDSSNATGIDGDQSNNDAEDSGAVYIFTRSAGSWSQQAYIKASNTAEGDYFGDFIFLSADGATLAVGAVYEDSNATGIDGDQSNNDAEDSGAVYLY